MVLNLKGNDKLG